MATQDDFVAEARMGKRYRLIEKLVKGAEPTGRKYQLYDEDVRGFALSVQPSGARSARA